MHAKKIACSAARMRKFSDRKWAKSLQILCAVDAQRNKTSACVAVKTLWRCRISASSCWRVRCRKRAHPAIGHAQNFAKICINDARICCKIFTISTCGARLSTRLQKHLLYYTHIQHWQHIHSIHWLELFDYYSFILIFTYLATNSNSFRFSNC